MATDKNAKNDPKDSDKDQKNDLPRDEQPAKSIAGEVPVFRTNSPFFDGVQLHPAGTEIAWVKPESWPVSAGKHFAENGPSVSFTPMNQSAAKILDAHIEKTRALANATSFKGSDQTLALLAAIKELVAARK